MAYVHFDFKMKCLKMFQEVLQLSVQEATGSILSTKKNE